MLAWGMTEITPIGTVTALKTDLECLPDDRRFGFLSRHGIPLAGLDIRIVNDEGNEAAWDGATMGELQIRGPWVTGGYFDDPEPERFHDGWFRTGDVATIDPEGYIQITDRTKDLIKSGGEWISSVDLENEIMAHPKVAEAAVIGVFHAKWQERPLACVVPLPDTKTASRSKRYSVSSKDESPSGGCRTMSCSSKRCRRRASASSTSARFASDSRITSCRNEFDAGIIGD